MFSGFDMSPQLLLSQAADLERPPTQEEVEAELATPEKSVRSGPHPQEGLRQLQERKIRPLLRCRTRCSL